jgi:hypothetical protein
VFSVVEQGHASLEEKVEADNIGTFTQTIFILSLLITLSLNLVVVERNSKISNQCVRVATSTKGTGISRTAALTGYLQGSLNVLFWRT